MRYVFKHEYRQNHSTLLDIIDLLFTWMQKHSKETENRDTVVYRRWEDRFVRIRKKWSSFMFGNLCTKSEPVGSDLQGKEVRDEWFPTQAEQSFYYYSNLTNFSTVHWQMWAFKTVSRSSKFLLDPTRKHGPKHPWRVYSSKSGLNFFLLVEKIWGPLYCGLGH